MPRFKVRAVAEYDFDIDVPEEDCQDLDDLIDYCLTNDPTMLVDSQTGIWWGGFNCGYLRSITDENGDVFNMTDG